jgi:GNAT superfamily N-acetyltransferase
MIKLFLEVALLLSINFFGNNPTDIPLHIRDNLAVISYSDATPDQKESVCDMLNLFLADPKPTDLLYNAHFKNNILISDDDAKGALIYQDFQGADKEKWRTIAYLVIDAQARGKGYGKYLMKKNEEDAQKLGIQMIRLQPFSDAVDFYEKIGFKHIETISLSPIMGKHLQSSPESSIIKRIKSIF